MSCRFTSLAPAARFFRPHNVPGALALSLPKLSCAKLSCALLLTLVPAVVSAKPVNPANIPPEPVQNPVTEIYRHADAPLLWSAFGSPKERAYSAIELLANAGEHGLDPERYATSTLYARIEQISSDAEVAAFDKLLTAAIWSFNEDLRLGDTATKKQTKKIIQPDRPVDQNALTALTEAIAEDRLDTHFAGLTPRFSGYKQLQEALATYRDYRLMEGWATLPADMHLKPGDTHTAVPTLRQRLVMTDGLEEEALFSEQFDAPLQAAIVRFQTRHGLQPDGEIGPATLAQLNVSVDDKIRSLRLNLARLRTLPAELPADRIQVNIPEFELRLYRDNAQALNMNVVVGSKRNPTPPMQDRLRHLVFNPYWYPTRKITLNEILPRLKRDPDYLERSQFEMIERGSKTVVSSKSIDWQDVNARKFPYRFRQVPGDKNSLGRVKFIFPNKQHIYLHDTPSRSLFSKRVRAFSHGCVRVEKPKELATELMAWDRGWTKAEVLADIGAAKRKLRKFKQEMDIYLLYQTAAVRDGRVNFFPDIYRHDRNRLTTTTRAPAVAALLPTSPVFPQNRNQNQAIASR